MAYSRNKYKRTVRCSYCHQSGHNKSSCPSRKERIEELRAVHGDDFYTVRMYDLKEKRRKEGGSSRTCSYCSQGGHNRSTCTALKGHMAETKVKNSEFRKAVYERLCANGIGIGALVSSDNFQRNVIAGDYSSGVYRVPQIITDINWLGINVWHKELWYFDSTTNIDGGQPAPIFTIPFGKMDDIRWKNPMGYPFDSKLVPLFIGEKYFNELCEGTHWRADKIGGHFMTVESPVPPTAPPAGWLESEDNKIKEVYKNRKDWQGAL